MPARPASADRRGIAARGYDVWANRRASPFSAGTLAGARLWTGWRMLLSVGTGILVAVVLIAVVPLFDALMTNIQLQTTLSQQAPADRNVEIQVTGAPFSAGLFPRQDALVRADGGRYLADFVAAAPSAFSTADPMLLGRAGGRTIDVQSVAAPQVTFEAYDYAPAAPHMTLIAGALPQTGQRAAGGVADALITGQMAQVEGLGLGDTLVAEEFGAHERQVLARVVGIWEPAAAGDPFWNGHSFDSGQGAQSSPDYPVLLASDGFSAAVAALPGISTTQHWVYSTQPARIDTTDMGAVAGDIGQLRARLLSDVTALGAQLAVVTQLDKTVGQVQQQLALLALPLYVVVAQVVGLALLFVVAMAGLLVDGQAGEIATLKSRGASATQLLGSYAAQGVVLAVLCLLVGPLLAGLVALGLVHWFVPAATLASAGAGQSYLRQLATPQTVLPPAAAGALLGIGAIVLATQRAARLDVLAFRREQGRATRQPFWQRYYLDLGLAALCAIGYLELSQFGGLAVREQLSQVGESPLLLAAPALLLLAGTLLLLRIFPAIAQAGARWAARGRGASGMLAFSQVARSPAGPSRLMLLLALSVGLGLFALTFDASLVRNAADRAAYQVGADVRLVAAASEPPQRDAAIQARLAAATGAAAVSPAYRHAATTTFDEGYDPVDLLAVDPATWAGVADGTSWRGDYAAAPLSTLMGGLRAHQVGAAAADRSGATAAGAPGHPLWAIVSQTLADHLHVQPGDHFSLDLPGSSSFPSFLVVGAVVREFPTLYPTASPAGFVVLNLNDCLGAIASAAASVAANADQGNPQGTAIDRGPNEYWIAARPGAAAPAALAADLQRHATDLGAGQVDTLRSVEAAIAGNPLQAGMRGLLLVGALTAAALAVLGTVVQAALAARQRAVQFAVLRTMGMRARQLTAVLLGEQVVVYLVGLAGGTLLGLLLTTATLPFLQFSDTSLDPATVGVPPYVLVADPRALAAFYAALAAAFAVALLAAARYAATVGLGKTLRLGED